jgi:hypothetical protein
MIEMMVKLVQQCSFLETRRFRNPLVIGVEKFCVRDPPRKRREGQEEDDGGGQSIQAYSCLPFVKPPNMLTIPKSASWCP